MFLPPTNSRFFILIWSLHIVFFSLQTSCSQYVIRTRKQMTSLQRSDNELRNTDVLQLLPKLNSRSSNNQLFKLMKALVDNNAEFRSLNGSKIESVDAYLDVLNKAYNEERVESIINITFVFKAIKNLPSIKNNEYSGETDSHEITIPPHEEFFPVVISGQEKKNSKPSKFDKEVLERHNWFRKKHGAPMLTYSAKISNTSQSWAEFLARNNSFNHRTNNKYGENLYMIETNDPNFKLSGDKPVDGWYSEIKYYNFTKEPSKEIIKKVGHFTQVIWKGSRELGVGIARNAKTMKTYVVCNYSPIGNWMNEFKKNVPPIKK